MRTRPPPRFAYITADVTSKAETNDGESQGRADQVRSQPSSGNNLDTITSMWSSPYIEKKHMTLATKRPVLVLHAITSSALTCPHRNVA